MKHSNRALSLALVLFAIFAAPSPGHAQLTWGGYLQTRFSSDFSTSTGFSIRRAKLYTTAIAPFDTNLSARMQAIFRWQTAGTLMLQDVYAEYRLHGLSLRAGQFVPEFSLQRLQPDAAMPVVERALVVDALVPSAETYARDIGAQLALYPLSHWRLTLGAFNGNGGNQCGNNDRQLLYVARSTFQASLSDSIQLHLGASFAYRNKAAMIFKKIFGTAMPFSGRDVRWEAEVRFASPWWSLQAEYLGANLETRKASGYYILSSIFVDRANEVDGLAEQFQDLDPTTNDAAWYGVGWNHYFAENKFKTQLAARAQLSPEVHHYSATLQLQLYIH
jgi:phosphate-selective porin